MTRFSVSTESAAVVAADRADLWRVLTDPDLLARLTPLLSRIEANGDLWRWHLIGIDVLGLRISPAFTERMHWTPQARITFAHQPAPGATEEAGAEGWYELADVRGGTRVAITLTLHVDLPLPKLARPAVTRVMATTMRLMGDRFAANLQNHLAAGRAEVVPSTTG